VPDSREDPGHGATDVGVVLDDEHSGHGAHPIAGAVSAIPFALEGSRCGRFDEERWAAA
jgi:hypothetical protein